MNFYLKASIDLRYIMRITLGHLILFFVFTSVTYASSSRAQGVLNTNVSIHVSGMSLRDALTILERKVNTKFVYSSSLINANQRISVSADAEKLSDVLTKMLARNGIAFELFNQQIVLSKARSNITTITPKENTVWADVAVTGKVTDEKGVGLPGVSVKISGTTIGTTTNSTGNFTLSVPADQTNGKLTFIYIGFEMQEVDIAGKTNFEIRLLEEKKTLTEVVVIGYGTQKKTNITGSISRLSAESIEERPITRVEQALQGQMAGVAVRSTSGSPGSDLVINVRGAASLTGSTTPLYIVDGVPLDNLSGINPSDIESIDVLKDASSAAIYGSRGSNGVVLITTKRGKTGKPVFTISAYTAVATPERKVDVMSSEEWITFNKKWLDRQWVNTSKLGEDVSQADRIAYAQSKTGQVYDTRDKLLTIRPTYGIYDPYWGTSAIEPIDWQDELLRSAPVNDLQLSVSGATDAINYSISGGAYDQKGIVIGSAYKRYSLRGNVEAKLSDRVKLGLSLAPSIGTITGAQVDGKDNAVARGLSFPGWVLAGSGNMAGADPYKFYDGWGPGANNVSPYVQAIYNERNNADFRMNTALNTTVKIIEGLNVNGLLGWNYRNNSQRTYSPTWIQGTWNTATPGALSTSRKTGLFSNSLLYQGTLNYTKEIGDHAIDALFGASQETSKEETSDQGYTGFPNDKTYVFDMTRGTTINQNTISASSFGLISYFGRIQYAFKNRYLFSASLRRDGSSKFGPDNRWGTFPAVSAGWKISEEDFAKNLDWLGTTKIRVSWGQAGNDRITNSNFLSNMGALNYPFGDSQAVNNGFVVGNIANSNLRWEKTDSYNLGLDLGLFQDRITLSADAYVKKTTDLLLLAPVSLTTGFSSMYDNIGNVDNKGLDLQVNTINVAAPLKWSTSFNVSIVRNKITALTNANADIKLGQGNTIIQRVGSPINSYYLLDAVGVLRESDFSQDASGNYTIAKVPVYSGQKPGDTKYRDATGDGKIDGNDYVVAGNYQPKFEWGMTNTFYYKNWDFSVLVQGRAGGDLLSIGSRAWNRATNDTKYNYMESWVNNAYWSEAEPGDGKVPAFFSAVTSQYDTNWMYSASYLRIKNLTLGYNMPVLKKAFNSIRLYASCDNVFLWDSYYPGYSPEAATQDNASSDWGSYPLARTLSFGLTAKF